MSKRGWNFGTSRMEYLAAGGVSVNISEGSSAVG